LKVNAINKKGRFSDLVISALILALSVSGVMRPPAFPDIPQRVSAPLMDCLPLHPMALASRYQ
jgi:hypothetical protein